MATLAEVKRNYIFLPYILFMRIKKKGHKVLPPFVSFRLLYELRQKFSNVEFS